MVKSCLSKFLDKTMSTPTTAVRQGILEGRTAVTPFGKKYYSFEGIPYGKPPVGALRFKDPQEPDSWTGVYNATKPRSKCAQIDPFRSQKFEGSEDCLYLNIYTPSLPSEKNEKLPVLFFVHGGRYLAGFGDYYRPDYFIDNDVVVVTINYRVAVLGFLSLNTPDVPGNAGLKDSVLALKWVKKNISNFNGDENNIVVFGESSGGGTVSSFLISKMTEGLFSKVIIESGVCTFDIFMVDEDHMARAKKIASLLDIDTDDVDELFKFLQEVPVEDLVAANCTMELSKNHLHSVFLPIVEQKFDGVEAYFTEYPTVSFKANRFWKVPVLVGCNSHEGSFFIIRDAEGKSYFHDDFRSFVPKYLHLRKDEQVAFGEDLKQYYFNDAKVGENTKEKYVDLMSDIYFNLDTNLFLDYVSKYHTDVWYYRFSYLGSLSTRVMKDLGIQGASHSDILAYQFYREKKAVNLGDDDKKIVQFLSKAWTDFAKYGNPSVNITNVTWLPVSDKKYCLDIANDIRLIEYPERDRIEYLKRLMNKYSNTKSRL